MGCLRTACCLAVTVLVSLVTTQRGYAQATETVLHNFTSPPRGSYPWAGLVRDHSGNLYSTTENGGPANRGVVFKIDATGHQTVLHAFRGGSDGAYLYGCVAVDSAGNVYGTTYQGGTYNQGVAFEIDAGGNETILHSFTGGADGGWPIGGVILDPAGNIYGTTETGGGTADAGVVFRLDPGGNETVLHTFGGAPDGAGPHAALARDAAGNLYGTTYGGGATNMGAVFKLDASGNESVLYSFQGGADGGSPQSAVTLDPAGNLYGTSQNNVYKIDTAGQKTVLYSFPGGPEGGNPGAAGVTLDAAGNLYGTTWLGGTYGAGNVFKVDPSGVETVLYEFTGGSDGGSPESGVIRDSAGDLYGTTAEGGALNYGAVFKISSTQVESVIYSFPSSADGENPWDATLIRDAAGNLYGTTINGGPANNGVVFGIDTSGTESVLYSFSGGQDGGQPWAGVTLDAAGNLYGTTNEGGVAGMGVVFKVNAAGQETVLHSFTGGADGAYPRGGVTLDAAGNIYGTTYSGGAANDGVVFKIDATGAETVLYSFTGGADGANPCAGVILDAAGNLYGTTFGGGTLNEGVVFEVSTSGTLSVLHGFTGGKDGAGPYGGLAFDSAGNLYGTTMDSVSGGSGEVFKLTAAGRFTVLYNFGHGNQVPWAGVTLDAAGNIYGTTAQGGARNYGIVFELSPTGQETVLHTFGGGTDGAYPYSGVVLDPEGNVYGTTSEGGSANTGLVFKLTP